LYKPFKEATEALRNGGQREAQKVQGYQNRLPKIMGTLHLSGHQSKVLCESPLFM